MDAGGLSALSPEASAATRGASGACVAGSETLCLLADRFEVKVHWRDQRQAERAGRGQAVPISSSDQSGMFQFFDPENIELVVKMLDGRTINAAFWQFYGALSDVEYWIVVRDTFDDAMRTYHNPPFELCGSADTSAFPDSDGALQRTGLAASGGRFFSLPDLGATAIATSAVSWSSPAVACVPTDTVLCLQDGRFAVEVDWSNPRQVNATGVGHTLPALSTSKTGFFWFFEPGNLELAVKLLDGRAINDRFWFFWGGLSDAEYTIRILDTATGAEASYHNEPYSICGGSDVNAI
jgi:hypothetical protein